ncbi:Bro-N domain-containing protein [Candidatus Saccharibacteria bacterium]|nr:Bro-N domain-containing protein [Candidatus Saccharibacteria bacterium]
MTKLPTKSNSLKMFEGNNIRSVWNEKEEEWYFSVKDVVNALAEPADVSDYLKKMKQRDESLAQGWGQIVTPLPYQTAGGVQRLIFATPKGILRIIQSIPSKKAEPFKLWLAKVGSERIDEEIDPELAFARAVDSYRRKGYSEEWINQRMLSIKIRNSLTDEWQKRGVKKGNQFAILTDIISKEWSGMTTREYKDYKGLKKQSLRDNMTDSELILNMLAENTAKEISKTEKPKTFAQNQNVAKRGGKVANIARKAVEESTGKSVVTEKNYLPDSQKRIEE